MAEEIKLDPLKCIFQCGCVWYKIIIIVIIIIIIIIVIVCYEIYQHMMRFINMHMTSFYCYCYIWNEIVLQNISCLPGCFKDAGSLRIRNLI